MMPRVFPASPTLIFILLDTEQNKHAFPPNFRSHSWQNITITLPVDLEAEKTGKQPLNQENRHGPYHPDPEKPRR